ncbi:MAG: TetR/AcrR family transcriptional regulator, partial [Bacteroidota bacterium]
KTSPVKERIIETASRLFYQNGYNLTGINEVIREAGIAKATLYHHFRTKDDLCIAYIQHMNGQFLRNLSNYILEQPNGSAQILGIFDFLLEFFEDRAFNGCWCINTVSEVPRGNESVRAEIKRQKDRFLDLIREVVANNQPNLHASEAERLAKRLYLLYEGAISEAHLLQEPWPIESARLLCEQLLD